ncbi:unnamed protein product [Alopecurus aequalis]
MGMNIWTLVASIVVAALGLLTVILGIAGTALAAQGQGELVERSYSLWCEYRASPAVGCGVVALLLALTTQIVASAATGCCSLCRSWGIPSEPKRIVAVILSAFSWILSIIVVVLFMVAAIVIIGGNEPTEDGNCVPPGTGEFAAATILFIITVVFQIASYILLDATTVAAGSDKPLAQESGIPIGQPAAETLDNVDQKAAAGGDPPPPLAPAASSDANVDPPPTGPTVSPKVTDNLASQV